VSTSYATTTLTGADREASVGYQAVCTALKARRRPPKDDPYTISVTELLQPPRIRALAWLHRHEIYKRPADPSKEMWALLGAGTHLALDDGSEGNEVQMHAQVGRWIVTGRADSILFRPYATAFAVRDYKTASAAAAPHGCKEEWVAQGNLYAHLWRRQVAEAGEECACVEIELVVVYKDWKLRDGDKGILQPTIYRCPVWSHEECQQFLDGRLALHTTSLARLGLADSPGSGLPLQRCTKAEVWGGQRCQHYCPVADYCPEEERPCTHT
jgi:hypothetical protein